MPGHSKKLKHVLCYCLLSGVDQRRMGSPFASSFLSGFLNLALREFLLATIATGNGHGDLDADFSEKLLYNSA